jgi:ABC-type multidrug transport system ATPase subunit
VTTYVFGKETKVMVSLCPQLLFLDEPTSGLDSYSAANLVMLLKSIARKTGAAVLCSIHQPSSEVFDVFDEVIFMKAGEVIYQGMF